MIYFHLNLGIGLVFIKAFNLNPNGIFNFLISFKLKNKFSGETQEKINPK